MPYEKGTAKTAAIPVQKLTAWETFLRTHGYPLEENPKPMEVLEGLWKLLNLWANQPRTLETVTQPATNPEQVSAPDPVMAHAPTRLEYQPKEWVGLGNSQSTKNKREWVLEWISKANSLPIDQIAQGLVSGQLDPYRVANQTGTLMRNNQKARGSISGLLGLIPLFYEFIGVPYKRELFKVRVSIPEDVAESQKKSFTYEEVGQIIRSADPELQAITSFHVSVGGREQEMFELRVRDVDFTTSPATVTFHGGKTKTGRTRLSFLSSETVGLLKKYLGDKPDPDRQLFQGWNGNTYYYKLMQLLKRLGITKRVTVGEYDQLSKFSHTPHSMRGTNLGITKRTGFPPDWAEILTGHATKVQKAYGDVLTDLGPEWQKLVEPRMRFLEQPVLPELKADKLLRKPEPPQDPMIERQRLENEKLRLEVERLKAEQSSHVDHVKPAPAPDSPPSMSKGPSKERETYIPAEAKEPDHADPTVLQDAVVSKGPSIMAASEKPSGPKISSPDPGPVGKCFDCMTYHHNPVTMMGTGGPCPEKREPIRSNSLEGWV